MRTDVKLGIVVAMVVVLVAGGYYMYRDRTQPSIPMGAQADGTPVVRPKTGPAKMSPSLAQRTKGQRKPRRISPSGSQVKRDHAKRPSVMARRDAARHRPARAGAAAKTTQQKAALQRLAQHAPTVATRPGHVPPGVAGKKPLGLRKASGDRADRRTLALSSTKLPPVGSRGTNPPAAHRLPSTKPIALTAVSAASVAVEKHRVQPGDSLSSLAVQYYGSEKYTQWLIASNKQLANPNRLKIGEIVNLPAAPDGDASRKAARSVNHTSRAATGPTRTYTVRAGDSFYEIAKSQLGDASRWKELFELNRSVVGGKPKSLRVGQVLTLPR